MTGCHICLLGIVPIIRVVAIFVPKRVSAARDCHHRTRRWLLSVCGRACLQAAPSLSLRRLPPSVVQHRCCASSWLAPSGVLMVSTPLPRSGGPAGVAGNVRSSAGCGQSMVLCCLSLADASTVRHIFFLFRWSLCRPNTFPMSAEWLPLHPSHYCRCCL